ncbi:MAG: LysR family transcriptional regulator [Rhodospirillaceae bacterium]|nr:LysR family transcriptional regulator [Rhodospirillaceae bacterium]
MKSAHRKNELHIRLNLTPTVALGPGKAELLDRIAETGSISAAAKTMKMSYRRAWLLLDELNSSFTQPVVEKTKGGRGGGGGATLTAWGQEVLRLYRAIETKSRKASSAAMRKLRQKLAR